MTSHLDDGTLQELLDGEIHSSALPPLQAHLDACAACRARFEAAREVAASADILIEALDAPPIEPQAPARVAPPTSGVRRWSRSLAWAASIAVAVAAGWYARGDVVRVLPPPTTTGTSAPLTATPPSVARTEVPSPAPTAPVTRSAAPPATVTPPARDVAPSALADAQTGANAAKPEVGERREPMLTAAPMGGGAALARSAERGRRDTDSLSRDLVATKQLIGATAMNDTLAIRIAALRWLVDSTDLIRSTALAATCVAFSTATTVGDLPIYSAGDADLTSALLALLPAAARPWRPASACGIDTSSAGLPSIELATGRPALQLLVGAPRLGAPDRAAIGMQHREQGRGGGGHRCDVERRGGAWVVVRCRATWAS